MVSNALDHRSHGSHTVDEPFEAFEYFFHMLYRISFRVRQHGFLGIVYDTVRLKCRENVLNSFDHA